MDELKNDTIRFPFVVDSPRAKEASYTSSKEILKLIFEITTLPQTILATMDYNDFKEHVKLSVKVIMLNEQKKLLSSYVYEEYEKYIVEIYSLLENL